MIEKREDRRSEQERQTVHRRRIAEGREQGRSQVRRLLHEKRRIVFADGVILQEISDQQTLKSTLKVGSDFESYLWVIVSSYYSMFYAATALLASQGIRATGQIVHKVTGDALIHFFVSNEKLAKLLEQYEEAKAVGLELIGREELMKSMQKKANELIVAYESERKKRSKFQYDIGIQAKRGYAQTSLNRAKEFVFEISKILKP